MPVKLTCWSDFRTPGKLDDYVLPPSLVSQLNADRESRMVKSLEAVHGRHVQNIATLRILLTNQSIPTQANACFVQ